MQLSAVQPLSVLILISAHLYYIASQHQQNNRIIISDYQSDTAKEGGGGGGGDGGGGGGGGNGGSGVGRSRWNETNFSWPGARQGGVREESDKQVLRLAGDWPGSVQTTPLLHTKTNSHCHTEGPGGGGGLTLPTTTGVLSPSKSEHQYDVPWSHLLPRKPLGVNAAAAAAGGGGGGGGAGGVDEDNVEAGNDYSDIGVTGRPWSVSDDTSLSVSSSEVALPASLSLPQLQLTPDNFTVASVSHSGCRLSLPTWGVSLVIPPQALDTGFVEEVFLAVVPLPQPPLSDGSVMVSPVVLAGPPGLQLSHYGLKLCVYYKKPSIIII